ncbi:YtxH domain-containing protein [Phocaeicola sartorii]|uniref:YtxH domain-containing protein n=1 Tax=Phocaeicola sartorii TaxID=671267 RepID=UPI00242FFDA4|nr:YtxH domain-containing protein [Phocaeicola sartorii]
MKNLNVLSSFLCGTVVGTTVSAVLRVLFAPDKGSNTRIAIPDRIKESRKETKEDSPEIISK